MNESGTLHGSKDFWPWVNEVKAAGASVSLIADDDMSMASKFTRQLTAALALDPLFSKVNGLSKLQLQTAVGYFLLLFFFFCLFKAPERYSK